MIEIVEIHAFGQVITAVLDDVKILDLRKGEVSDHAKQCAQYHAAKKSQGMIQITRVDGVDSFLPTVEKSNE